MQVLKKEKKSCEKKNSLFVFFLGGKKERRKKKLIAMSDTSLQDVDNRTLKEKLHAKCRNSGVQKTVSASDVNKIRNFQNNRKTRRHCEKKLSPDEFLVYQKMVSEQRMSTHTQQTCNSKAQ